jgi:AcrR family transcriptional regulator
MTKKEKIECTAQTLFFKHGFKKVSIDELCRKSNVSRKTFYTYYPNKMALVIVILRRMMDEKLLIYRQIIDSQLCFAEKMEKLLLQKIDASKQISMEFVSDFFNPDAAEILAYFQEISAESLSVTKDFFLLAQANGEMNSNLSIDYVMWMMQQSLELCKSPDFRAMFPDAERMTKELSQFFVYGIMPVSITYKLDETITT